MTKAANFVNAGTFVTLDNIKATITTSGNRGLSLAAVSGSFTINVLANYAVSGGAGGSSGANVTITTTPSTSLYSWNFTSEGDGGTYIINIGYSKVYRIIHMIGAGYNNNFISIERLI